MFFFTDLEFVKTFLYTYQSFSTPERLLKKLIERYNVVRPLGMSLKEFSVMKQTIQARVINAFKLWVDLSADFKGWCNVNRDSEQNENVIKHYNNNISLEQVICVIHTCAQKRK